jgi:imidazolonepropionase-like amidohydrolase
MCNIAIKCGRLIDATGNPLLHDAVIIIENSKIVEVGENLRLPQGVKIIDATSKTVMPGLIDGHVHLDSDPAKNPFERYLPPDSLTNLRAAKNARITLSAGYTSILGNCGYGLYADLFLKQAIDSGWMPGPRLWTSGPGITSTLRGGIYVKYGLVQTSYGTADGPEEVRKLVRQHVVSGVDWIKVLATYAVGSPLGEPTFMNLNADELQVIIDEAHAQRKKVKAHLEGRITTKDAINAGIDIVLHGFFLDDDDVEQMRKRGIPLIPTLAWRGELLKTGAPGQPDWYLSKAQRYGPPHFSSFKRAHEAGVLIAAGSDCSGGGSAGDFLRHGENAKELEYLVSNGLTPMEAVMAGTKNVAEAFGLSQFIGSIEPGKFADIIVVNGDPLTDITILQEKHRIETVIKHGEIVLNHGFLTPSLSPPLSPYSLKATI